MMMYNYTRILIASAMSLCLQAHALAETFVFSKTSHGGKILAEHSVVFENETEDRASFYDVERVDLPACDRLQKMVVSARYADAAVTPPPTVAVGTMVSVRRTGIDDVFVVAVMESRAVPSGCMPSVSSTSSIFQMALKSGERVRIAQQPEVDGTQSTWSLRRE
jgi:hypothetical protein